MVWTLTGITVVAAVAAAWSCAYLLCKLVEMVAGEQE